MSMVVHGKWLLAGGDRRRKVIKDGALYIEDGVIRDVGKYKKISKTYRCDFKLGSEAHMVIPGLVNSHHHGNSMSRIQAGLRDCPLEVWLPHTRLLLQAMNIDIYFNTLLTCIRLIESGVTTTIHHFYGRDPTELFEYQKDLEKAIKAHIDSGMRVAFAPSIEDQNHSVYVKEDNFVTKLPKEIMDKFRVRELGDEERSNKLKCYLKAFDRLLEKYGNHERINLLLGPAGVQWCSDNLLMEIKKKAHERHVGIHIHLLETRYQKEYGLRIFGKSLLRHLSDLNFLGPEVSCAHSVWLTEEDIDILADAKTTVVHNPSSNLRLFSGTAPVVSMMEKGVNVALGIDNMSINDDEDMFQEMRLCSLVHRTPGLVNYQRHSKTLDSFKILDMATIHGAKVAGFDAKIGIIDVGANADLTLVNMKSISRWPLVGAPIEDILIGCAKGSDVDTVIIGGEIIMRDKKFLRLDKANVLSIIQKSLKDVDTGTREKMEQYKGYIKGYYESWDEGKPRAR